MRIAQVAPLFESVPPKLYGGTERVVSYLTEELVRQGHEVTLFASGDSETRARLVAGCPQALWRDPACRETLPHHVRLLRDRVPRGRSRFDVIHFHIDYLHFPLVRRLPCRDRHDAARPAHPPDLQALFDDYPEVPLVSISDAQRRPIPRRQLAGDRLPRPAARPAYVPRARRGAYLAFLGRMSPEKRLDRAIEIARRAGMPLKIAAKIYPEERDYFERTIEPLLRRPAPLVEFIGEVGGATRTRSSATPARCCSRSTGPSRSGW